MKVIVSGHHTDTGDSLRFYVEEHMQKLEKFFDAPIEPRVTFEKEHNMYKAEILIKDKKGNHSEFFAVCENSEIHAAFNSALEKIVHQVRKDHEKVKRGFRKKMKVMDHMHDQALASEPNSG